MVSGVLSKSGFQVFDVGIFVVTDDPQELCFPRTAYSGRRFVC
jgi:hypothetical protein